MFPENWTLFWSGVPLQILNPRKRASQVLLPSTQAVRAQCVLRTRTQTQTPMPMQHRMWIAAHLHRPYHWSTVARTTWMHTRLCPCLCPCLCLHISKASCKQRAVFHHPAHSHWCNNRCLSALSVRRGRGTRARSILVPSLSTTYTTSKHTAKSLLLCIGTLIHVSFVQHYGPLIFLA